VRGRIWAKCLCKALGSEDFGGIVGGGAYKSQFSGSGRSSGVLPGSSKGMLFIDCASCILVPSQNQKNIDLLFNCSPSCSDTMMLGKDKFLWL
jgi:hypothetical protein